MYLSADPIWTPDDILLGQAVKTGTLSAGGEYSLSAAVTLPGVVPGDYYFLVRSNWQQEVFEATALLNNTGVTADTVRMDVPELTLGVGQGATLDASGDFKLYKVEVPANESLAVSVSGPEGVTHELYASFADAPTRSSFDARGIRPGSADQVAAINSTHSGTYYVLVYGANVPSAETFTIKAALAEFEISAVQPLRGSNTGQVTISIHGSQFDTHARAQLVDQSGSAIEATAIYYVDTGLLSATFELSDAAVGLADVQIIQEDGVITQLSDAFEIVAGTPGRLVTNVNAPSRVRLGREIEITIEYANQGETDILAPVLILQSAGLSSLRLSSNDAQPLSSINLIGVNPDGPAGILPPGAKGTIKVLGIGTQTGDESYVLSVGGYSNDPIDWTSIQSMIRPVGIDDDDWNTLFNQLQAEFGTHWSDYRKAISRAATLLTPTEGDNRTLRDTFALMLREALADLQPSLRGTLQLVGSGRPLPGTHIQFFEPDQELAYGAITRSDGTFAIPGFVPGGYEVRVDGFVTTVSEIVIASPLPENLQLTAYPGGELSGTVIFQDGAPARNVLVSASSLHGESFAVKTDASGRYSLPSMPADTYEISASGENLVASPPATVILADREIVPSINLVVDRGGRLSGIVTGPGGPVEGALVAAIGEDGTAVAGETNAAGIYWLSGLSTQRYDLRATADGLAANELADLDVIAGSEITDVDLTLESAGSLQGVVMSTVDGSRLPFALLTLQSGMTIRTVQADSEGAFIASELPPGSYTVRTNDFDLMVSETSASVFADQVTNLDFTATRRGMVHGTVTDSGTGDPVSDVVVRAKLGSETVATTQTNSDGQYSIENLEAGGYRIVFGNTSGAGMAVQQISINSTSPVASVDFDLSVVGGVSGRVLRTSKEPLAGATVHLTSNDQSLLTTTTDSEGRYSFLFVAGGTYQLQAASLGFDFTASAEFTISSGTFLDNTDLVAGGEELGGTIRNVANGTPIPNATIVIERTDAGPVSKVATVTTNSEGQYAVNGLIPGSYLVTATASGFADDAQPAAVSAGSASTSDFALGSPRRLSVMLRDQQSGLPLSNVDLILFSETDSEIGVLARTGSDGSYAFDRMPAGQYRLLVRAGNNQTQVIHHLDLTIDRTLALSLPQPTTSVSGTVSGPSGPIAGALVVAQDESGTIVGAAEADSDGTYKLISLPPESYSLSAVANGYRSTSFVPVVLTQGLAISGINFALAAIATTGRIQPIPSLGAVAGIDVPPLTLGYLESFGPPPRPKLAQFIPIQEIEKSIEDAKKNNRGVCSKEQIDNAKNAALKAEEVWNAWAASWNKLKDELTPFVNALKAIEKNRLSANAAKTPADDITAKRIQQVNDSIDEMLESIENKEFPSTSAITIIINDVKRIVEHIQGQPTISAYITRNYEAIGAESRPDVYKKVGEEHAAIQDAANAWGALQTALEDLKTDREKGNASSLLDMIEEFVKHEREFPDAKKKALSTLLILQTCLRKEKVQKSEVEIPKFECILIEELGILSVERNRQHNLAPIIVNLGNLLFTPVTPVGQCPVCNTNGPQIRNSFDPNDKIGPDGFGENKFIQDGLLKYEIQFENDPALGATLPAQEVFVTDSLDEELDLTTVEFTQFGFNNFTFDVPAGLAHYETTIDLRPEGIALLVPVTLDVDLDTRVLSATFRSYDPLTGALPDDIDAGFLPVNDATLHNGEGFFRYQVQVMDGLPSGTEIRNQAEIVFDVNDPILTPQTVHTLDNVPPTSAVTALPEAVGTSDFMFEWSGQDDSNGSGIENYDLYVSEDGGPYDLVLKGTTSTHHEFTSGQSGHTYSFVSIARDNAGHVEPMPLVADTQTLVIIGAWVNRVDVYDVDNNGEVTARDALVIINEMGRHRVSDPDTSVLTPLPPQGYAPPYYDVTADGKITALDALRVINQMARISSNAGESVRADATGMTQRQVLERATVRNDESTSDEAESALPVADESRQRLVSIPAADRFATNSAPALLASDSTLDSTPAVGLEAALGVFADDVAEQWAACS